MPLVLALLLTGPARAPVHEADVKDVVAAIEGALRSPGRGDALGDAVVRSACRTARDPRAATAALAFVVGGVDVLGTMGQGAGRVSAQRSTLQRRHDWMRHFVVAAALAHASTPDAAEWAAVQKERSDSRAGGSGFDASDLQAGLSGIAFAAWLDEPRALATCGRAFSGSRFVPALRRVRGGENTPLPPLRDAARQALRSAVP